jgi:integrase
VIEILVDVPTTTKKKEKLPRGIRRRGNSLYAYLTHLDGHEEVRCIGNVSVSFAKDQRVIWQREIVERRYVKPVPRTDLVTFAQIADKALEYYKAYTRCWDVATGRIGVFKSWFSGRTAESITATEIVARLLENTAPRGKWTKCTSNEYRLTLLRIYALAVDRGEITVNPVAKVKRHKVENERTRELSFDEEDALRAAIRAKYPRKEVEFDLGLHLMCRRSNLYGQHNSKRALMEPLQWSAVNLDFRVVNFTRSKSGKAYRVPINDTALAAFKELQKRGDGTGAVVLKPSGIELQSARKWFETCLKEAKIQDFCWHDLRHTAASRLRAAGVSIEDIRYLLGHGAKSITERYAHPSLDVLRVGISKLDRTPKTQTGTNSGTGPVLQFPAAATA